jgi:hypothetical protein
VTESQAAGDLTVLTDQGLFGLWAEAMTEMRRRDLIRSSNNPTGDYAEVLVARVLGVEPVGGPERGYDVISPPGVRIQVKSRRAAADGRVRGRFTPIRDIDAHRFDELVAIVFNHDFTVREAWRMPWAAVSEHAVFVPHVRGSVLPMINATMRQDPRISPFSLRPGA